MKYLFVTALLLNPFIGLQHQVWAQNSTAVTQTPAQIQAKNELDEAARNYREGNFAQAQVHSERALAIDPENKVAPFFIARTIHAQYKPGNVAPENLQKAREAIVAYQRILVRSPTDEESFKAIAYLYGSLKEDELLQFWVLRRAADSSVDPDKRAEAYIVLASKDWDCSFKITELPSNKATQVQNKRTFVTYRMPKERADFDKASICAQRGLEMTEMAIGLNAESEAAWSYKTNLLLELAKLAEMSGDHQRKVELRNQYKFALEQTAKFSEKSRQKQLTGERP